MRWRWVVPVAAAAGLAGCGGSTAPPAASHAATTTTTSAAAPTTSTTATSASTTTTTTSASPGASSTTTATTTSSPSAAATPAPCRTVDLQATVANENGTAGSTYETLDLVNVGSASCSLQGYPGVSLVAGSNGHQVGAAAARVKGPEPVVVLHPGGAPASALLRVADAGNYGASCRITRVRGFRIYPPNQTAALYVPHPTEGCANAAIVTLFIQPLQPT